MLSGSAFSLIYAFIALPLARLADRTNRRTLISIAVAIWSTATMLCGLASHFFVLLLARIGVGGAEAAQLPATMSMIGDIAPADRRGLPISILTAGSALGFAGGGLIAGILNDHFGWHVAMMVVGLPGLLLAAVMFLTVREPVRGAQETSAVTGSTPETLLQSLRRCASIRTLYPFAAGYVLINICFSGWLIWMPAFLMRVDHLSATKMGAVFGAIIACATIAALVGGPLSDRLAKRDVRWRLYYCAAAAILSVPLLAASTLLNGMQASLACLFAYTIVSGGLTTVTVATYLSVAPPSIRGIVTATMNILALGLGGGLPVLFGAVNDVLKQTYGDQSLRFTLLICPLTMGLAAIMFLLGSRSIREDQANLGVTVAG
jgi:MFS family permease